MIHGGSFNGIPLGKTFSTHSWVGEHSVKTAKKTQGFQPRDFDVDTALSRMTNLSKHREELIARFIIGLKTDLGIKNLTDMFDCIYLLAQDTFANSTINLAQNAYDLTNSGNGTFITDTGFTGDGVSGYLNTSFNPSTVSGNFTQNNASFGCYINKTVNIQQADMGAADNVTGAGSFINTNAANTPGGFNGSVNSSTIFSSPANTNLLPTGLFSFKRETSLTATQFKNGSIFNSSSTSSVSGALRNASFFIANFNTSTTGGVSAGSASSKQFAFAFIGNANFDHGVIYKRAQEYLQAIGAAVG